MTKMKPSPTAEFVNELVTMTSEARLKSLAEILRLPAKITTKTTRKRRSSPGESDGTCRRADFH